MNDFVMAFKMALLAGKETGIQFKNENDAKVAFPILVQELKDYVNSPDYLALMAKEQMAAHYRRIIDKELNFHEIK